MPRRLQTFGRQGLKSTHFLATISIGYYFLTKPNNGRKVREMTARPEFTFHLCALHGKNYQPVLAVPSNRTKPNNRGRDYTHRDWKKDSDAELKKRSKDWVDNFTLFVNACLHRNARDSLWYFYHIFLYLPEEATIGSFLDLTGPMEKAFALLNVLMILKSLPKKSSTRNLTASVIFEFQTQIVNCYQKNR